MSDNYWKNYLSNLRNSHTAEEAQSSYITFSNEDKVTNKDLAHNLRLTSYRIDLGNKVLWGALRKEQQTLIEVQAHLEQQAKQLKKVEQVHQILKQQRQDLKDVLKTQGEIKEELANLRSDYLNRRPLSKQDVEDLVVRISEQPKIIEQQTEALTVELTQKVDRVEKLIHLLEQSLVG